MSVGPGEEKQQDLREAWAFALPSHQENFGVAVLSDEAGRAAFSVARVGEQVGKIYERTLSTASSHDGCGD